MNRDTIESIIQFHSDVSNHAQCDLGASSSRVLPLDSSTTPDLSFDAPGGEEATLMPIVSQLCSYIPCIILFLSMHWLSASAFS